MSEISRAVYELEDLHNIDDIEELAGQRWPALAAGLAGLETS